jgi:hypothetical protein
VVVSTAVAMAQVMRAIGRRGRRTAGDKQRSSVTCIRDQYPFMIDRAASLAR